MSGVTPMNATLEQLTSWVAMHHGETKAALVLAYAMRHPIIFYASVWAECRRLNRGDDYNTQELARVWLKAAGVAP